LPEEHLLIHLREDSINFKEKLANSFDMSINLFPIINKDSEIGCPDARDGFRNVVSNLAVTIKLSMGK
jgi:hypothetical protein